jgi:hypothetical protein
MSERVKLQGVRFKEAKIVGMLQRGFEYRVTLKFARVTGYFAYPKYISFNPISI